MRPALDLAAAVLALGLAGAWWRREPRRWRIGVALTVVVWLAAAAALDGLDAILDGTRWGDAVVLTLPWALALVAGVVLVVNGLRMVRREGRTLANLLSFALGAAMTAATVLGVALFWFGSGFGGGSTPLAVLGVVVLLLPGYPALVMLSYLLYCLAYVASVRRRPRPAPAAVVVLGSGLVDGQIPRLLANRLDAALRVLHAEQARGRDPLLVPSGGQGEDEPMAEGAAMTTYLADRGVDPARILTEDRATTTEENLVLSLRLLEERGVGGPLRVVTSNYHAGRAALLTRSLGIDADVTPARTAWYFLPSAFLREVAAAVTYRPWVNAAGLVLWAASTAVVAVAVVLG
ncbi:YdcF family protein [Intrasporangium flavum]|uniref:YdcF family protein n=1 Tax=Intrasporangium flavum TaxID=1428657 RepID=UPI00096C1C29|nr:YdcF family protein [Intrasporangium flavum]